MNLALNKNPKGVATSLGLINDTGYLNMKQHLWNYEARSSSELDFRVVRAADAINSSYFIDTKCFDFSRKKYLSEKISRFIISLSHD